VNGIETGAADQGRKCSDLQTSALGTAIIAPAGPH
jgi:hypothetical protein